MKFLRDLFTRLTRPRAAAPAHNPVQSVSGGAVAVLFDRAHYLAQFTEDDPARAAADADPLRHYLSLGWREYRNPHVLFDVYWYLTAYPDVAAAGVEPFGHYLTQGWRETRRPHPRFDGMRLLAARPELLREPASPLALLAHLPVDTLLGGCVEFDLSPETTKWPSYHPAGRPYRHSELSALRERIDAYRKSKKNGNRIVIHTCITGGYDTLRIPEELSPDIDYVAFTDRPIDGLGVFDIRLFEGRIDEPAQQAARRIKLNPHLYSSGYEIAIWCDANVVIRAGFREAMEPFIASDAPAAFVPNLVSGCLYEEAAACALRGADTPQKIVPVMLAYQAEGYPFRNGLIESNLFAVRPRHPEVARFFSEWWRRFLQGSRRDQLGANYVMWKQGLTPQWLLGEGLSTRNHQALALVPHGSWDQASFAPVGKPSETTTPIEPSAFKFHLDAPTNASPAPLFAPAIVRGWFLDAKGRPAVDFHIRFGDRPIACERIDRPDVRESLGLPTSCGNNIGFEALLPSTKGAKRLVIKATTAAGETVRCHESSLDVMDWPAPWRLSRWTETLGGFWKNRRPGKADTVLVLIPVKPGTPAVKIEHARELATRALAELPAKGRIVTDDRGVALSRKDHPWRIAALAGIRQSMVERHLKDERWVFWADLDLSDYPKDLILTLIRRADGGIAAPMVFIDDVPAPKGGPRFYDLAGFVEKGRWTDPSPPYFRQRGPVYDLDSVGCCYLVPADLYRRGARHEIDPGSKRWIETYGDQPIGFPPQAYKDFAFTEHYPVCAFARSRGIPVRAFADLIVRHEKNDPKS